MTTYGVSNVRLMAVPATVVYFTAYDCLKYKLGYIESDPSTIYIPVLAGCLARGDCIIVLEITNREVYY